MYLAAVTTQHQPERLVQASGIRVGGCRHRGVLKAKGPSPQSVMALAKSVRVRLATSPGNKWARMAAAADANENSHVRVSITMSKETTGRPSESMTRRLFSVEARRRWASSGQ